MIPILWLFRVRTKMDVVIKDANSGKLIHKKKTKGETPISFKI